MLETEEKKEIEEIEPVEEPEAQADGEPEAEEEAKAPEEPKKPVNIASPLEGEGIRGDGQARWYVIHTYAGHENKVRDNIKLMVKTRGIENLIEDVMVPTMKVVDVKRGVKKLVEKNKFPGYVMIKMIVTNESWYLVRNTQGVTGFLGQGSDPIPLTAEELTRMGIEKTDIDLDVKVGDRIKVIGGAFETFFGVVTEISPEKQKLKANIDAFGRDTSVDLEFTNVEKC